MHLPNWRASYNMNDYRRVSCGKTSWSLNFNHMNISWFWLHMEIFAICLHLKLECEWRKIKGEESIGGIKKRLRNSTWIGERISLNWIKVYGFRQSSLLSLLRLCRMLILYLYWHWHFKLFSVDISWQVITQSCKLLGIFEGKKNPLCFYTNVPSLNKLEEYVNFTDCLKIWPKDYQDTNQKKLEKWISTRACDVMCIGKILIWRQTHQDGSCPEILLVQPDLICY